MLHVAIDKKIGSFQLKVQLETDHDILALLGASGCGKSMTLKCIAGIETPDSGKIILNDRVLFDSEKKINLPPQERKTGYLFQNYALFDNMTIRQNIGVPLRKLPKAEREEKMEEFLKLFRLTEHAAKKPHQLSGGQQQRVALARILASQPEVLLLDEPFSALDDYLKWQLELELSDTLKQFSGDILFVSHSKDEVCHMCSKVCVISNGQSEKIVSVDEMMRTPETVHAALISGCKNFSSVECLNDRQIRCIDWGITLDLGRRIPEHIDCVGLQAHHIGIDGTTNGYPCRVLHKVNDQFSDILILGTPAGDGKLSRIRVDMDKSRASQIQEDDTVYIQIRPMDILLLKGERPE